MAFCQDETRRKCVIETWPRASLQFLFQDKAKLRNDIVCVMENEGGNELIDKQITIR